MNRPTTMEDYDLLEEAYGEMMHLSEAVINVLNIMSNDCERGRLAFCEGMAHEHRTLQQCFTRLVVAWLVYASDPEYRYDLRNEATHNLAVKLLPILMEESRLPFI